MLNLMVFLFGISYPCQSASVEHGDIRLIRPEWSIINARHETACEASKNVEALMITLNINPFDAVEHEEAPAGIFEE